MPPNRIRLITGLARGIAAAFGLLFAAGVIMKVLDWQATRDAMTAYSILDAFPPALPAAGGLSFEFFVAVTLLLPRTWHRWGLPAAAAFLIITGVMLGLETLAGGGGGDCGCIPFLPRDISLLAAAQNGAEALFLGSLWRYVAAVKAEAAGGEPAGGSGSVEPAGNLTQAPVLPADR